jgi:hypothetical protein
VYKKIIFRCFGVPTINEFAGGMILRPFLTVQRGNIGQWEKTPKNGNQCKFLNFKVTHFKKIKGVGARLKNDISQKKLFCLRGLGDMREKPRLSKMGPVSSIH